MTINEFIKYIKNQVWFKLASGGIGTAIVILRVSYQ